MKWRTLILSLAVLLSGRADATELLQNGGFESGDLSGWMPDQGAGNVVPLSPGPGCQYLDPRTPRTGSFFFSSSIVDGAIPGTPEISLVQVVDLSGFPEIPAGMGLISAQCYVTAATGCAATSDDTVFLRIELREGGVDGSLVGQLSTPPLDPTVGFWNLVEIAETPVPPTADTAVLRHVTLLDAGYQSIDIGVDDLSLDLVRSTSAIEDVAGTTGPQFSRVVPSPTSDAATASFYLPEQTHVGLRVFDTSGRRVRNLISAELRAGMHAVAWDGRTDEGTSVPAGLYFLRLSTMESSAVQRLVITR